MADQLVAGVLTGLAAVLLAKHIELDLKGIEHGMVLVHAAEAIDQTLTESKDSGHWGGVASIT
jgi:hypothetical protein